MVQNDEISNNYVWFNGFEYRIMVLIVMVVLR